MELRKTVIAPDSFKGALTSKQVADIISDEVSNIFPDCAIVKAPVADGGEGSVEIIIAATDGRLFTTKALSPDDRQIEAGFGITANGTAVIEMARSSGITRQTGLNPMTSSTFGFGQLILAALERGAGDFILCIGGSATTDGGCGMAAALGVRFIDKKGADFVPCGGTLANIARFDMSGLDERISGKRFSVMCDVDNPLYGVNGAAYIYGPQKGANPEQVLALDEGLRRLGHLLYEHFDADIADVPGAGAAGGLGAGCIAFLGGELVSGIDAVLELCNFRDHVTDAELVITGEGKLDSQSFSGKVLSGILRYSGDVPVWSICGVRDCDGDILRKHGVRAFEVSEGISVEESMGDPEKYLRIAARKALLTIKEGRQEVGIS